MGMVSRKDGGGRRVEEKGEVERRGKRRGVGGR
jgi:hypothetical protein